MLDAGDPFDLVGDVLDGQFRVDQFAGEGDLSVVYRGHHLGVNAPIAIKCLNLPPTLDPALLEPFLESFREGATLHYRLAQGNLYIAQSIAYGTTLAPRTGATIPFLVREWLEGWSLSSDIEGRKKANKPPRTLNETITLLDTAAEALAYAHSEGVVHLSINPRNLFVVSTPNKNHVPSGASTEEGSDRPLRPPTPPFVKVLDFGVATVMNGSSAGLRVMFPTYAAPEQLDRSFSGGEGIAPAADVYAFALIVYECLAGRPVLPPKSLTADVLATFQPDARPTAHSLGLTLSVEVEKVLSRALDLIPSRRQKDVGEFWRELKEAAKLELPVPVESTPSSPQAFAASAIQADASGSQRQQALPLPLRRFQLRRDWVLPASFVVTLLLGVSLFASVQRGDDVPHRVKPPTRTLAAAPERSVVAPAPPEPVKPQKLPRFDRQGAVEALDRIAKDLPECARPKGGPRGPGSIRVRFEGNGHMSRITIGPPYSGTKVGACIVERFAKVTVSPFHHSPMAMNYTFDTIPWDEPVKPHRTHRSKKRRRSQKR